MPTALKKYVFLTLLIGACGAALAGYAISAAALSAALFLWLAHETRERRSFAFIAQRRCPETRAELAAPVQALAVSQSAPWALAVMTGQQIALLGLDDGRPRWTRDFAGQALALAARPDGRVLWASEERLHLCGADGVDVAELGFEAPLYRQSYRILVSADGTRAFLHTPWFMQAFDPDLKSLGPRLPYEQVGHYMKYAALNADGSRVYTAGALLLNEDESQGGDMEARWDAWDLGSEGFSNAWKEAYQSYNNSHLRGLSLSADGSRLCAELWQEGYEFRLFDPSGALVWKRAGEHPVLSQDGAWLLWESHFDGVVLSKVGETEKVFTRKFEETVRHKAVSADGHCLLVVGRRLLLLGPDGAERWQAWFKSDPQALGAGPAGRLVAALGRNVGVLRSPWNG